MIVHFAGRQEPADRLVEEIKQAGGEAIAIQADVRKAAEVKSLFDKALAQFGHIDVVVNNAGIMLTKPIVAFTDEEFTNQVDINLTGAFFVLREAMTRVADNGSIIDISTSVNRAPIPGYGPYGATKSAAEETAGNIKAMGVKVIAIQGDVSKPASSPTRVLIPNCGNSCSTAAPWAVSPK